MYKMTKAEQVRADKILEKFWAVTTDKAGNKTKLSKEAKTKLFEQLEIEEVGLLCRFFECNITKLARVLPVTLPRATRRKFKPDGDKIPFKGEFRCLPVCRD